MSETLFQKLKPLLKSSGLPDPGPGPRPGVQPEAALNDALKEIFAGSKLPAPARELVRALVLLWHDHLAAAHDIAANISNRDGSFVHAIMHRREPDYSNAMYWFHRVGEHPSFPQIARRAAAMLDLKNEIDLRDQLLPHGRWDPIAFVDTCEQAAQKPGSPDRMDVMRELQRIEVEALLEHLAAA